MRIGIDLDGVCYAWEKTARYLLNTHRGYALKESPCWTHIPDSVTKDDWRWLWSDGVTLGLFRFGHIIRGAFDGIRALHDDGHELVAITHRPESAVKDTHDWLDFAGLPFSERHILTNEEPKSTVDGDVLIDDKIENVIDWIESDPARRAVLFDQPWNRVNDVNSRIFRAIGWPDVVELIVNGG